MADPIDVKITGQPIQIIGSGQNEVKVNSHVTAIDRTTFNVQVCAQEWEYNIVPIIIGGDGLKKALDDAGKANWELVAVVDRNLIFKKSKVAAK